MAEAMNLEGAELDAAVARTVIAAGQPGVQMTHGGPIIQTGEGTWEMFRPSVNWAHAGPIIEREAIALLSSEPGHCTAAVGAEWANGEFVRCRVLRAAPTPLVAAMRAYLASGA
jgi:hypothetical protein